MSMTELRPCSAASLCETSDHCRLTCWKAASLRASVSPAASSRPPSSRSLASSASFDRSRPALLARSAASSSRRPQCSLSSSVLAVELNWMDRLGIL